MKCTTVKYLGPSYYPNCFELEYEPGQVERVTMRELRLLLRNTPKDLPVCTALAAPHPDPLPDYWDLSVHRNMRRALETLMPGTHHASHIAALCNSVPGGHRFEQGTGMPECVPTTDEELAVLLQSLNFSLITTVVDPWSGTGTIARKFNSMGHMVTTNDICHRYRCDSYEDALQPALYRRWQAKGLADAIITSPWARVADVAAPLAAEFAGRVACVLLPGSFLVEANEPRSQWLASLKAAGRIFCTLALPLDGCPQRPIGLSLPVLTVGRPRLTVVVLDTHHLTPVVGV